MEQSESFKKEIEQIYNKEKHLSFSALKAFLSSPKHFYRYKMQKETTKAMESGKMFHMAILEPEKFKDSYFVLDDENICAQIGGAKPRSTSKYKAWKLEQIELNIGKELISIEDYNKFQVMGEYLYKCSATKELMNGLIHKEKRIEFEHNNFNIIGYIDGEGEDYILDLKKVADASFKKVRWTIQDMRYDMQAAIYSAAVKKINYYLIFIDNDINVLVVKLHPETLQSGFVAFETSLAEFQRCIEEDAFNSSYEFFNNGYIEV